MQFYYTVVDYICLPVEILSGLLYIYLLIRLLQSRKTILKTPFFMLVFSGGIADIASVLTNSTLRHLVTNFIGPPEEFEIYYSLAYLISGLTFYVHMVTNFLVSLNRCTAVSLPKQQSRIWTFSTCSIAILFCWIIGFCCISFRIKLPVILKDGGNGKYIFLGYPPEYSMIGHLIAGTICGGVSIGCVILGAITIYFLINCGAMRQSRTEKRLAWHSLIAFFASLFMVWQQFTKTYASLTRDNALVSWISAQYFWINDILIFSNLYSIIWNSKQIREMLFKRTCTSDFTRINISTISVKPNVSTTSFMTTRTAT